MAIVGPGQSWRLIHNGTEVLDLFESTGYTETNQQLLESANRADCIAEIARLNLTVDPCLANGLIKGTGILSSVEFMERFPDEVQLVVAGSNNPVVKLWYDKLLASGEVHLDNDKLIQGLNALINAGAITAAQANTALGN